MAQLDSRFIVGIQLGEYFVDPTSGLPLSGGRIYFYKDLARVVPKLVYQLTGSPPNYEYAALPNYMELSDAGTIINADGVEVSIYYYPYDADGNIERYYVKVVNSDLQVVKEFQAWPNNFESGSTPGQNVSDNENQISNSQFVDVLFEPEEGNTITFSGIVTDAEYEIAPNWSLVVSSNAAGSIIVGRDALAGAVNADTNPPFLLTISPQGNSVSSIKLRQRLDNNPDIWARQYIAGTILVTSLDGINHSFEMQYSPSVAVSPTTVFEGSSGQSGYTQLQGTVLLGPGVNTDDGDTGYDDIDIILPVSGNYGITSVQAFGTNSSAQDVPYQQETVNRQKDHLFHYYNPLIQQVPVPSITEGWDFKVNPCQFGSSTVAMGAVASQYLWDQLIGWQNVNSSTTASRASPRALTITTSTTNQFALIQYMSGTQLRELLANDFSVLIKALTNRVSGAIGTVSFWATTGATLPNVATGTNLSLVLTMDANGKPATFNGTWTEIPRNYRGDGRFTIPFGTEMSEISLEGWNKTTRALDATYTYAAIVVGFESADASTVTFDSIAVTPGLLARPYAPLSYNETLTQMQYYYEKSYAADVLPGTATGVNVLVRLQTLYNLVPVTDVLASSFSIEFRNMKRTTAVTTLYSPTGPINTVRLLRGTSTFGNIAISNWSGLAGSYGVEFYSNNTTPLDTGGVNTPSIDFHYTSDARYGIVL